MSWKKPFLLLITIFVIACSPLTPTDMVTAEPTTAPSELPADPPEPTAAGAETTNTDTPQAALAAEEAMAEATVFLPTIQSPTKTPPASSGMVANHTVIDDFDSIPVSALQAASAMKTVFFHQSTGGYIKDLGFECLAGDKRDAHNFPDCTKYETSPNYYNWSQWNWTMEDEWVVSDAARKTEVFKQLVPQFQAGVDVIGMKYCYVDGWNVEFERYRAAMETLEDQYPNKIFIWSTSVLWGEPGSACNPNGDFNSCKKIQEFNQQVRAYAAAHNKPLYDTASIESRGGECIVNGYEGTCPEYRLPDGNHPNLKGSIRLAQGYWWLMARLSGWDG